jgi:hypothetical protein
VFRPVWSDPAPDQVRRITFVPFLRDGQCVLIEGPGGPGLPAGDVLDGEDYLIDTVMRVPLQTAGFRYQHFRPFGLDGDHLYAWIEGAPYSGGRAHGQAQLTACAPEQAAERLRACGQQALSAAVTAAAASYRNLDDLAFYADNLRTLQRSYLRGSTAQEGSGFGGDAEEWRQARQHISEGIGQSGTFLDVGCANGLLMESVAGWCAERDLRVEPYGIDIAPGLVELARRRLPQWADRIWVGNAIDWIPPGRRHFDYVHLLLDCVPQRRRAELIRHHLTRVVMPGTGRLLVSDYAAGTSEAESAAGILRRLGFPGAGHSSGGQRPGRPPVSTAWIDARP